MDEKAARKEIQKLTELLKKASFDYYHYGNSTLEDSEYDIKENQLRQLEQQFPHLKLADSPINKINDKLDPTFSSVQHKTPMLSLSNLYSKEEFIKWYDSMSKKLQFAKPDLYCDLKIDGMAISLFYKNGLLHQAITRGDGEVGENLTKNIKNIGFLPEKVNYQNNFEIRGEVFFPKHKFNQFNQKRIKNSKAIYKNPRNATVGIIRMKDTDISDRGLEILIYDMLEGAFSNNHNDNIQQLKELGFFVNGECYYGNDLEAIWNYYLKIAEKRADFPFEIDGIVCRINNKELRNVVGADAKKPKWAAALKFNSEQAISQLLHIENSVGRSGIITPVAWVNPVQLLGTQVQKASLYNYDQIQKLDIRIGDYLIIEKGGDIIPKVIGVDLSKREKQQVIIAPTNCPFCNSPLQVTTSKIDIYCNNQNCPAIIQGALEHFVSKKAMDIEFLGKSTIKLFLEKNLISTFTDIYYLKNKKEQLEQLEGFGEKSITNLFDSIEQSKQKDLSKLIHGLGIPNIGDIAAKQLAGLARNIPGLIDIQQVDLEKLDNFGIVLIDSAMQWIQKNKSLLYELKNLNLCPQNYKLINQKLGSVVITGSLSLPREEWKDKLIQKGFRVSSSISPKTNFILVGEISKTSSKLKKAKELGIKIMNETEFTKEFFT